MTKLAAGMTLDPPWLQALREDARLNEELGLRWLTPEESVSLRESWCTTWNQIPYDEEFHARAAARLERCVPLAEGSTRRRRLGKTASTLVLVHDPQAPDVVWLSLSSAMPSLAWASGGASAAELRRQVAFYTPTEDMPVGESPRHERLVKSLEVENFEPIKSMIEHTELWLDDASWGSAFAEDPWSGLPPDAGMMALSLRLRTVHEQAAGRWTSFSYRTLWSRSVLTVEQHPFGLWVFDVRYRPADDRRAIETLAGAEPGRRLPSDLPVDVASSLMRGGSVTHESLRLYGEHDWGPFELATLCAAEPGEPRTIHRLREAIVAWQGDERLPGLLEVLNAYEYRSLLGEAAALTSDAALRAQLTALLAPAQNEEVAP